MVFSNNSSNQANKRNDNSSNQNNKAHKEGMRLIWTSKTTFRSDDKTNPAEAGFLFITSVQEQKVWLRFFPVFFADKQLQQRKFRQAEHPIPHPLRE